MQSLDTALAGVTQVVEQVKREGAESRAEAERWRREHERERERVLGLEAELAACQAKLAQASLAHGTGFHSPGGSRCAPVLPPRSALLGRRNTISLGHPSVEQHQAAAALRSYRRLSIAHSQQQQQPSPLQHELSWDTGSGGSSGSGGVLTLSRLSRMLGACLLLGSTARAAKPGGQLDAEQDLMGRQESTFEGQAQVSLLDDGGGAGVGATAAAAVSVALAESWAAAAGATSGHGLARLQREARARGRQGAPADGSNGGVQRQPMARFKLMAAVPRNEARRTKLQTSESRASLAGENGDTPRAGSSTLFPSESAMALDSLMPASPRGLDDAQEATWRACGSHLKLQWLSPPSTVLVVYKPVPEVVPSCLRALAWLLRRGLHAFVEPAVHAELAKALAQELERPEEEGEADGAPEGSCWPGSPTTNGVDAQHSAAAAAVGGHATRAHQATGRPPRPHTASAPASPMQHHPGTGDHHHAAMCGAGGARLLHASTAPVRMARDMHGAHSVDLEAQLRTWDACSACDNFLPGWVADQLELVITLGGDGTVLWTCSMFSSGAVPPIVPFAMGSLGFMTPFPIERMECVLSRTTSAEHGFPLMLRHRLQCRILRAHQGGSSGDLSDQPQQVPAASPCGEEMVVLNEVVIDRGATASLTNLQVYVDQNFVTTIQGDGLIVATPTGSTAYSLAAGGSMVHPGVPALLFTPICPHTISSRPLVFPEHVVLRVKVPLDSRTEAYCSFDGRARQPLWPGDSVLIRMSPWPVPMVCSLDASHDWFLSVREGLNWNLRKVQSGKGS